MSEIESAVLSLLLGLPRTGRNLRSLLNERGFDLSAPAFYLFMHGLEQDGLVDRTLSDHLIRDIAVKEAVFSISEAGRDAVQQAKGADRE